jgi:hypothetical protein
MDGRSNKTRIAYEHVEMDPGQRSKATNRLPIELGIQYSSTILLVYSEYPCLHFTTYSTSTGTAVQLYIVVQVLYSSAILHVQVPVLLTFLHELIFGFHCTVPSTPVTLQQ